jgi:hypothetical protein
VSGRTTLDAGVLLEDSRSVDVAATPANGTFRPNPPLGSGTYRVARLGLERASGGIAVRHDLQGKATLELGEGPTEYIRATLETRWLASLGQGAGELLSRTYLGAGSDGLPPHRSSVLGGRGTLLGEPFRAYGGRAAALAHVEWRFQVPAPAISLGSFASTGRSLTLAPFLAAGWTDRPLTGLPWDRTRGIRPVAGLALEWLMRLLRLEAGFSLRDGGFGLTVGINRDWWGIL